MTCYAGLPGFRHCDVERVGILLVNSGTPDSPTTRDVRRFLRNLLSDPRVVELPRAVWLPILHGVILRTRPARSAERYRQIWTANGSPLLALSESLREALAVEMSRRVLAPMSIEIGMLYATPSVPAAIRRLTEAGARPARAPAVPAVLRHHYRRCR